MTGGGMVKGGRSGAANVRQHKVVAVTPPIAEREHAAVSHDTGAFGKTCEVADDRLGAVVADEFEALALVGMEAAEERKVEPRADEVDRARYVDLVVTVRPRIGA